MFRLSFGWENLENIEEQPSVFVLACVDLGLRVHTCSCGHNLDVYAGLFLHACIYFSSVCNFIIIPHHFCTQLYVLCHISPYCASNIIFLPFLSLNHEFNHILFLQVSAPYYGRRSTNQVLVRYNILTKETQGHVCATSFEPVISLMPKRFANVVYLA